MLKVPPVWLRASAAIGDNWLNWIGIKLSTVFTYRYPKDATGWERLAHEFRGVPLHTGREHGMNGVPVASV